ncbi:hypothetical protein [Proteiniphilum acetatigenes]|uniref:hypothetical protein n=1 Tax=Proteiniphilum acetatigenes TaxID=294710 RepID=UPI0003646275|nr:hypothetical protein [Proteiniphilum acetatigenes]SFK34030.1 hypothetical protein SAMN05216357_101369 [Porphyromonadaceae bacterium KH3CP3RA]
MKKIYLIILGIATLLFALTLNFKHALNDYGVVDNKLHVEVLAQSNGSGGGDSSGGGSSGGAIDHYTTCTVTETRTCTIGMTIPEWVPYIGGLRCDIQFDYPVTFHGSQNNCIYTGVPSHYCNPFPCRKN